MTTPRSRSLLDDRISPIRVEKPADMILRQLRNLIADGTLQPGDRLPPERELAERFGVGRGHVREALRKLEFYGVLQTFPQSGTVVASLGRVALEQLISNLLALDRSDVIALAETRGLLEIATARLAASRADASALAKVEQALERYRSEVAAGREAIEDDHLFHLAIANATGNPILASLVGLMTPDVIRVNHQTRSCEDGRAARALREHQAVFEALRRRDPGAAEAAMAEHMRMTLERYRLSERSISSQPRANRPVRARAR